VFIAAPHSFLLFGQKLTIRKNWGRQAFTVKIKPNYCFFPFFTIFSAFVHSPSLKMNELGSLRSQLERWNNGMLLNSEVGMSNSELIDKRNIMSHLSPFRIPKSSLTHFSNISSFQF
jgi:hypothetical protein